MSKDLDHCWLCFRWTSKYCAHASLLMKIDDDVLLKTETLPSLKKSMRSWIDSRTPLYIGTVKSLLLFTSDLIKKTVFSNS